MGVDALMVACLNQGSDFFVHYPQFEVKDANNLLFRENPYPYAKHIDGIGKVLGRVAETTAATLERGDLPVVLAGDHSTAAGTIAGIRQAYPHARLGVVWIDAHADLHSPYTTPSGNMHGMPLAVALCEDNQPCKEQEVDEQTRQLWEQLKQLGVKGPKLRPEDLLFVGVRDTEGPEDALMDRLGIRNIGVQEVRQKGVERVAQEILARLAPCDLIYVSFDVDSMDPQISRGTGTPVSNGLSLEQAMQLNALLVADERVCTWEMVEVNPTLDSGNAMADAAFRILQQTAHSLQTRLAVPALQEA